MEPKVDYQPLLVNNQGQQYSNSFSAVAEEKLDLSQILAVARRRAIIIAGVAIAVSGGIVGKVLQQVPNYEGKFQLLVGSVSDQNQVEQITEALSKTNTVQVQGPDYQTQIQVLWSPQVMTPIVQQIQTRYPDIDYNTLRHKLTISRLQETKILEVRYQDSNPDKIQFILEAIANGYIQYSETEQRTALTQGLTFVNQQTQKLQQLVNNLQQQIQNLRQDFQIVDPETQGQLLTSRVSDIIKQRQETETQLIESQKLYRELQNQLANLGVTPQQAIAVSALSEAPRYQALLNQLSEVETQIATESARFTPENPALQTLRDKQQNLLPLIAQEATKVVGNGESGVPSNAETLASPSKIRSDMTQTLVDTQNQIQVLQVRRNEIVNAENRLIQQIKYLPVIARRYGDLQRRLNIATESLNRFLAVQEKLQIDQSQKTPPWQKLSSPQKPERPISPNIPRGIALGTVAGLIAGASAGLLAEKMDHVFHSTDELKDSTGLPLLGTIPFSKELKKGIIRLGNIARIDARLPSELHKHSYRYPASPLLEAFRSLHANLHFLSPDQPIRSLVISSAVPADGKSTVAAFLAQAAAAMGERVLLVDSDLRRPQIHVQTDLPNVWGLSNVISSDINVNDVIQQSPLEDNLFVLTAGQIPPDPTRLLCSKKMENLVQRFQSAFNLVIFDTPPLLGLADARLLAAHTDGIVMVVGLGRTDRAVLTQVLYALKTSHARVLGMVANGVKGAHAGGYDYYHRYYSRIAQETPV